FNLVERFRDLGIPCDAVHLDQHYMRNKEGFTWDLQNFPHPAGMVGTLKEQGIKTVLIVNPGVRINPEHPVWREGMERNYFCRRSEGNLLSEEVWPGLCNFPDFTSPAVRDWWAELYRKDIEEIGVRGLWNDMNEPVIFPDRTFPMDTRHEYDGMPCSHEKAHNIYGQCMAEASLEAMKRHAPGRRPFLLSRSGFAGLQRFSATWTGDNRSNWEHLKLANFQCQRLAASGISFAGSDAGGFLGHPTPELFCRWMQMAAFHGLFRNHSSGEFGGQEPWMFGLEAAGYVKAAIEGRYRLLPYIYTQFRRYAETGMPVLRSLALQCFENMDTYWRGAEFFFGDHLYVIPIHEPQEGGRFLYIPEGIWYSYHDDSLMKETGRDVWVKCPLDFLPVYVRGGAVVPRWPVQQYVGEIPRPPLSLDVWWAPSGEVESRLYEDAGDGYGYRHGECAEHEFLFRGGPSSLELSWTCQGDPCAFHEAVEVVLHGLSDAVSVAAAMDGIPCGSVRRDGRVWRIPVEGKFDRLSVTWDRENPFSA
ncbi:TIM-barrel domain-containing protein, partial [Akkermansia sp.]